MATEQAEYQVSQPQAACDEATEPGQPRDLKDVKDDQGIVPPGHENSMDLATLTEQQQSLPARHTCAAFRREASKQRVPKLRPAADVLNRLRWDATYDSSDFIVGYVERFEGIAEIPLNSWLNESTEEDFIPQHRIRYFKRISDVQLVWERDSKIDKVFGSGASSWGSIAGEGWTREVRTDMHFEPPIL